MAKEHQDILLDQNGDPVIANGDFVMGDGRKDDCYIILKLNTGSYKRDPILGPNLITLTNGHGSVTELKQRVALHLRRDGKEPKKLEIVNGHIKLDL